MSLPLPSQHEGAQRLHTLILSLMGSPFDQGCAGNISIRDTDPHAFWITPSARPYATLEASALFKLSIEGGSVSESGEGSPSSEWRLHRDLYQARPEIRAILHAHSPFATALACQQRSIPAFHYMVARFGGADVRCAPYALFGSEALSQACLTAMEGRWAALLAHHGMVVCSPEPNALVPMAMEFERLCEDFWRTCVLGHPPLLNADQMREVMARFVTYRPHAQTTERFG
jgi:L-fuculose-phosphate aldolase